jgi:glutamate:GABA antiporter
MSFIDIPVDSLQKKNEAQLRRTLGLPDLLLMQVLLVVGITWAGLAARLGEAHIVWWVLGVALLFLPVAGVVDYCARLWPQEGGVYQWTKHALGPFAGFMTAWNFAIWAVMVVSVLGVQTTASLGYALGQPELVQRHGLVAGLDVVLFGFILAINVPGLGIGRWIGHFGTVVTLAVTVLLAVLVFVHPHASAAHPHVSPQRPLTLAWPLVTLLSLNLFSKLTFNSLTGLEQVAVFGGEIRGARRNILRSAWIAAPVIALIYMLMSASMLTYTPAAQIDLIGPVPQALAAAFGLSDAAHGRQWGALLGSAAILVLAAATLAQFAVIVAETSRLPMVAAWDHLLPAWFTRLHPRYRTPVRSLTVIVALGMLLGLAASAGTGAQEAFQLLVTPANVCYGITYVLMFAVPLAAGERFGQRPGILLRIACLAGMLVTLLSIAFELAPVVEVKSTAVFALKAGGSALVANIAGALLYWRGSRTRVLTPATS